MSKYDLPPGHRREFRKHSGSKEECESFLKERLAEGFRKVSMCKARPFYSYWEVTVARVVKENS